MSKKYKMWHGFFMPFYSSAFYRDVGKNWRGTGYGFLFVILAICWIPITGFIMMEAKKIANTVFLPQTENIPQMHLKDGRLSVNAPMPLTIVDTKTNQPQLIIDTSGKYMNLKQTNANVLVTEKNISIRDDQQIRTYQFSKDLDLVINKDKVRSWIKSSLDYFSVIFYPSALVISYIYRILQTIIYAAIGCLIIDLFLKTKLPYKTVVRLSVMAVTPPIILSTIAGLVGVTFPFEWLLYFILAMIYLTVGMKANQNEKRQQTE